MKSEIEYELDELGKLANMLNSVTAQIAIAEKEIKESLIRLQKSQESIDNIQGALIKHFNKIYNILGG